VRYQKEGSYAARKRLGRKSKIDQKAIEQFANISPTVSLALSLVLVPGTLVEYYKN